MDLDEQIKRLEKKIAPGYWSSIDVGPGWYQIVLDCDQELTTVDPHYTLYQVKEKFGGLRYYCASRHPSVPAIVKWYEARASETCEVTGRPGVLMSCGGWLQTLNPRLVKSDPRYFGYTPVE